MSSKLKFLSREEHILRFQRPFFVNGKRRNYRKGSLLSFQFEDQILHSELCFFPGLTSEDDESFFAKESLLIEAIVNQDPSKLSNISDKGAYQFVYDDIKEQLSQEYTGKEVAIHPMLHLNQIETQTAPLLKIKLDPKNEEENLKALAVFLKANPQTKLRIDANQRFSPQKLTQFWERLSQYQKNIDYFEEPCQDYQGVRNIPIALDENAKLYHTKKLALDFLPKALVIKPTLWGDFQSIKDLSKTAMNVVISSSFEHPRTMRSLIYLASYFPATAHGLSTFDYYDDYSEFLSIHSSLQKIKAL